MARATFLRWLPKAGTESRIGCDMRCKKHGQSPNLTRFETRFLASSRALWPGKKSPTQASRPPRPPTPTPTARSDADSLRRGLRHPSPKPPPARSGQDADTSACSKPQTSFTLAYLPGSSYVRARHGWPRLLARNLVCGVLCA